MNKFKSPGILVSIMFAAAGAMLFYNVKTGVFLVIIVLGFFFLDSVLFKQNGTPDKIQDKTNEIPIYESRDLINALANFGGINKRIYANRMLAKELIANVPELLRQEGSPVLPWLCNAETYLEGVRAVMEQQATTDPEPEPRIEDVVPRVHEQRNNFINCLPGDA
jgi:hypothetical protein